MSEINFIDTTVDFQYRLISSSNFIDGRMTTRFVDEIVGESEKEVPERAVSL